MQQSPSGIVRIAKPYNDEDIERDVIAILRSGRLVQGEKVKDFEKALSEYIGCKHVVAVNSGTAALHSAILATRLKEKKEEKKEIITTPLSFAATANAAIHSGCKPVFVDVDPETFNIDPDQVQEKTNDRTLAIEPVDVFGLPSELDKIKEVAKDHGITVVEDAAEAIGARYKGRRIGSISSLTCFSTYATKNLHTGEGGFVTTDDDNLAETLRLIRNQGQVSKYHQTELGYNFRMLEISAAVGLHQLRMLDDFNRKRKENALYLRGELESIDCLSFQSVTNPEDDAWYMFALLLDETKANQTRDSVLKKLKEMGVEADVAWPMPIHLQPYYRDTFGYKEGSFPSAESICKKIFQLPIHPFLTRGELEKVANAVKSVLS